MYKNVIYLLFALLTLTACSREDDIDEIFVGKTWYMLDASINRKGVDVKNFYTPAGESAYYIAFSTGTFYGTLSKDDHFAGTWTANGKHQTITLTFTQKPTASELFDKQLYNILNAATSYSSGAEFLHIKDDNDGLIYLSPTRGQSRQ